MAFRILSFKPFVFLGMISYSLYIWHWPIFAYARYTQIQVTSGEFVWLILLSIVVATVSYKFIENPLRKLYKKIPLVATLIILVLVPAIFAHHFDRKVAKYKGYPERDPNYTIRAEWQQIRRNVFPCWEPQEITDSILSKCTIGDKDGEMEVLLVGDSWSEQSIEMVDHMLQNAGVMGVTLASAVYLPFIDTYQTIDGREVRDEIASHIFPDIANKKYKYVVMGNSLPRYYFFSKNEIGLRLHIDNFTGTGEELFIYSFEKTVDFIIKNGAAPVFITGIPDVYLKHFYIKNKPNYSRCGFSLVGSECEFEDNMQSDNNELEMNEILHQMQKKYPQIITIDVHDLLCFSGKCSALIDGYPLYRDMMGHIAPYASHRLGEMYLEKQDNPFKTKTGE